MMDEQKLLGLPVHEWKDAPDLGSVSFGGEYTRIPFSFAPEEIRLNAAILKRPLDAPILDGIPVIIDNTLPANEIHLIAGVRKMVLRLSVD